MSGQMSQHIGPRRLLHLAHCGEPTHEEALAQDPPVAILNTERPFLPLRQSIQGPRGHSLHPNLGPIQEGLNELQDVPAVEGDVQQVALCRHWQCPSSPISALPWSKKT